MNPDMAAAVFYGAGDIRLETRRRPALAPGMVLVRVCRAGICGSDIHYYGHGRCGGFVPNGPFVLGHELSGEIGAVADGVEGLAPGTRVTVNPARACGGCEYCTGGRRNLCPHTVMLGSASTTPPTDGAFAAFVAVRADQCHPLPETMSDGVGAMIEPFAVALEAVKKAGTVSGRRVLVTGGGPIGLLVAMTARMFGAAPVALSDVVEARRRRAAGLADLALDPAAPGLRGLVRDLTGDGFDVVFEASGSAAALRQAFDLVRPGGTIVQIGTLMAEEVPLPANRIMSREIKLVGSFRYGDIYEEAIRLAERGRIDLEPLVTSVLPLANIDRAFQQAMAKDDGVKVQLSMS
ncbi:alcohol dehydrogenase catalytic domain-containing protein [Opitutus sp. GAS368]|jgi:L-idonate 5-dehydrogenase|uniref:alcohol dehydrogenase catalytic domain-containing protein n=1 Tax=Opitutus sp. GAS368 TaxID=1882749 RepID=UPI00087DE282|nr:alcohol dehydrogenase catalytic domain-containing protein [Opitutus sp. GAS368]SDS18870.1 L-idonate 5-dehydrogenase [Opitutus sp. GAS368]